VAPSVAFSDETGARKPAPSGGFNMLPEHSAYKRCKLNQE
jgi:hypothetical protein